MYIVYRAEHQDAGPGAQHGGGQGGAGAHHVPLQAPGDCYWFIPHTLVVQMFQNQQQGTRKKMEQSWEVLK